MTTNTTAITNRFGQQVTVGTMVDIFSFSVSGVEGGEVEEFYQRRRGGKSVTMALVRWADGGEITVEARMLVPRGA